jgi:hypothetical protein
MFLLRIISAFAIDLVCNWQANVFAALRHVVDIFGRRRCRRGHGTAKVKHGGEM